MEILVEIRRLRTTLAFSSRISTALFIPQCSSSLFESLSIAEPRNSSFRTIFIACFTHKVWWVESQFVPLVIARFRSGIRNDWPVVCVFVDACRQFDIANWIRQFLHQQQSTDSPAIHLFASNLLIQQPSTDSVFKFVWYVQFRWTWFVRSGLRFSKIAQKKRFLSSSKFGILLSNSQPDSNQFVESRTAQHFRRSNYIGHRCVLKIN